MKVEGGLHQDAGGEQAERGLRPQGGTLGDTGAAWTYPSPTGRPPATWGGADLGDQAWLSPGRE